VTETGRSQRVLEEFRERVVGLWMRRELDATTVAVFRAFEAGGVRSLLLKGPALARALYRAGELRGYSDVDLLVAPQDLHGARRALRELGCVNASEKSGVDDVAGVIHSETWLHPGEGVPWEPMVVIDLHRRLAGCDAPAQLAWDALEAWRTWIELEGARVPVLDRAGLALHIATHAAQHGPLALKAMADLERAIARWPTDVWRSAASLADELRAIAAFAAGLRLSPAGAALARELDLPSTEQLSWEILHRQQRPRGTFHLRAWAEARGLRERTELLRRALLPTRQWLAWEYPGAGRSRPRLWAAYARHLLRSPWWALSAWWFDRRARRAGR
jgi:hypothetical protein